MQITKNILHYYLLPALTLLFISITVIAFAQTKEKEKPQVKVKIVKIVDGDTSRVEKTMEESSVQDFTKQFQNIKGKNVQVMITVDGTNKDRKGKKEENLMHFNFNMDSSVASAFGKCFMFSDSALCKKFV